MSFLDECEFSANSIGRLLEFYIIGRLRDRCYNETITVFDYVSILFIMNTRLGLYIQSGSPSALKPIEKVLMYSEIHIFNYGRKLWEKICNYVSYGLVVVGILIW